MKNICFITTTRADYGLLKPLIYIIKNSKKYNLILLVTGTHLLEEFGNTYLDIENDFEINYKINIMDKNDLNIFEIMSNVFLKFPVLINKIKNDIDLAIILGDRFEILAISQVLFISGVKICHLAGGDITKGALDDEFRNSITQFSNYHMPFSEKSKNNLINMNVNINNIFLLGNPGLEIFLNYKPSNTKEYICNKYKLINNYILVVFHPETKNEDNNYIVTFFNNLIKISKKYSSELVIIKSNCDPGYTNILNQMSKVNKNNFTIIKNLDRNEYLSLAYYSQFYIGNSSSGIYELPYLEIPIINVGKRQHGRELSSNIINCNFDKIQIEAEKIIKNRNEIIKNIVYSYKVYPSTVLFKNFLDYIFFDV